VAKLKPPPKPKAPTFGAFKAAQGTDWRAAWDAGRAKQKAANQALHKAKKGTPEYAAALANFKAAQLAIPHKPHEQSGFGKIASKLAAITVPVLPGKKGIQLTGDAQHVLGSKTSKLANTALQAGGAAALAGVVADVGSGFLSNANAGGATIVEGEPMTNASGGFLDDFFGGLNKAGDYAVGLGQNLARFRQEFGSQSDPSGGASGADMGPIATAPAPSPMAKWIPWAVGGLALLVLLLIVFGRKR
jgi:hypothetical protein